VENKDLKEKYEEMHSQGSSSWFGQGDEERELILKMGEPWNDRILEIGCGEGILTYAIELKLYPEYETDKTFSFSLADKNVVFGVDYSGVAIQKAKEKYPGILFDADDYRKCQWKFDRIVMQGVLEHLDDPFVELKWMMDNLLTEKGDVITSSPCFLNPRGIVWMILDMFGAVMSKTDLHFLNPWEFTKFAKDNSYEIKIKYCDSSWGNGTQMVEDLTQRIPLAMKDGNIPYDEVKFNKFMEWFSECARWMIRSIGATAVYRITK